MTRILIDLSHPLHDGVFTHPGLPGPRHTVHRSRQEYEQSGGMPFQIDRVDLVGNTGTYLDSPFHRYADGPDLAALPLDAVADLPVVVVDARVRPGRAVDAASLAELTADRELTGAALLILTGGDDGWGTPAYAEDAPYLTEDGARWITERRAALVGIDAVNIDDLADSTRPAHSVLLGAGVLVLEHLTGIHQVLAVAGGRLHAAPLPWQGVGTWPVRAYVIAQDTPRPGEGQAGSSRLRCATVVGVREETCEVVADGNRSVVPYAEAFPSPRSERVAPGHLVALAGNPGGLETVVWRWYDAVALGEEAGPEQERLVRLWEPAHGEVLAQLRRPDRVPAPGTRAYLSAGLPGADWWLEGPVTADAAKADVDLAAVEQLGAAHDLW